MMVRTKFINSLSLGISLDIDKEIQIIVKKEEINKVHFQLYNLAKKVD